MDRRSFLRVFGSGVVATATIAEAGMLAEFMSWLKRNPVWSFPSKAKSLTYFDLNAATINYIVPRLADTDYKDSPIFTKLRNPEWTPNASLPAFVMPLLQNYDENMERVCL
jgi:hypothetical protein